MAKYIVNRDKGWNGHPFGEAFESSDPNDAKAAEQGYLIPADPVIVEDPSPAERFTKEEKATLKK